MKHMDDDFLENDLDWFLSCKDGLLAHFATRGRGPIPEEIKGSIDNYKLVYDYFSSLPSLSDAEIIESNLPIFPDEERRACYLKSFVEMSHKGLFSYDYMNNEYKLISKPKRLLKYSELPDEIKAVIHISSEDIPGDK